jgi:hypothetical protein
MLGAWMFRYEPFGPALNYHRNRLTGATIPWPAYDARQHAPARRVWANEVDR